MKRRHFLQFAGSALAAIGMSQADFLNQAEGYGQAIAQGAPRKLALLVGVNDYPSPVPSLRGCLTDVDLQYELLTSKFGFAPSDVLKVSDSEAIKPTRQNVLDAYNEHLVKQAKSGDIVVFHYSGHGVPVKDPDPIYEDSSENGAILLNDPLPRTSGSQAPMLPVIMGRTLFLLARSLQTKNVTTILDSCHSGGGTRGSGLVRAVPRDLLREGGSGYEAIPAEFELQRQLLAAQGLSPEDFLAERKAGISNGLSIGSAQFSELALDAPFDGFQAGAFSYLLTRYLWQLSGSTQAESIQVNLTRSTKAAAAAKYHSQVPLFQSAPGTDSLAQPIYFTAPANGPAEAVITNVSGDQVEYWLGGLSSQSISVADEAQRFTVLSSTREPVAEIEQVSRNGLRAIGKRLSGEDEITSGMLLRETLVGLESNPQLKVGVDASLGEEVEEAIASLSSALVSEGSGRSQIAVAAVDGETAFDYLFGRMSEAYYAELSADGYTDLPPVNTISLFSPALDPTPASYGRVDETVTSAVNRLKPQLKLLLVNKVLKALSNTSSSLPVSGEIFTVGGGPSVPLSGSEASARSLATDIEPFVAGSKLRVRVTNSDPTESLYLSCLVIDPAGKMTVVYPYEWDAPEDASLIPPDSEEIIPRPEEGKAFEVGGAGFLEVMTIASTGSLRNALRGLQEISRSADGYVPVGGDDSLGFLGSLLSDFDNISRAATFGVVDADSNTRVVDGGAIAISSTVIEVA
ncbi:MAG: caspase family protein [Phormidesmis sp.]